MRFLLFALIEVLLFAHLIWAQEPVPSPGTSPTKSSFHAYVDPANGVSFRFPASWLLNQGGGAYIPTLILQKPSYDPNGDNIYRPDEYVALVGRDTKQGPYGNTNLINGWFLYRVVSGVDEEQCYRNADHADDPSIKKDEWKADWTTIGGVRFRHGHVLGQALCNQSAQDVYATLRLNRCYLFETQINTICEQHGENGIRDIAPKELREINQAFDKTMHSVRFATSATSANLPSVQMTESANGVALPAVKVLFASAPHPPPQFVDEGGLTVEALYPRGGSHPNYRGSFAGLVAQKISTVTVTWSDSKRFKTHLQTKDFVLELLSNAKTETYGFHIWSNLDAAPCLTATVNHVAVSQGRLLVWCNDPVPADLPRREYPDGGVLKWAYQDGSGNWWWAAWGGPMRESIGTVTGKTVQIEVPRKLKTCVTRTRCSSGVIEIHFSPSS